MAYDEKLDKLYESMMNSMKKCERDDFSSLLYSSFHKGKNSYYRKDISETKNFDEEWITTMESYFPSIDRIVKAPPTSIRFEEEVVNIEKARKINSASVRHLASHTQNIREVKDGYVTPKKILTTFNEQENAIYENRFIKTLIKRVQVFIRNRHTVIKENVESFKKDHLNYVSNFEINGTNVDLNLDLLIKQDLDNESINQHNKRLLARVERLKMLIDGFASSPFMQGLTKAKEVVPPIMKTNIILKNPDFKNAYSLWLFLDRYSSLGYDVSVKEKDIKLTDEMNRLLDRVSMLFYVGSIYNSEGRKLTNDSLEDYNEKIKKSTKIARTNIQDVVERPNEIILADTAINETYLNEYRKLFNKKVKEYDETTINHDTSIKKAIRDIIAISNAIFESVFDFEEEEDYFRRLVDEKDYAKELVKLKEKVKLSKMVREAKEVDYKNAVRLEKNLHKEIQKANNQLLKSNAQKQKDEAYKDIHERLAKEQLAIKKNKEKTKKAIANLEEKQNFVASTKELIAKEKAENNIRLKEQAKKIVSEEKAKLTKALKELEAKHQAKIAKEKEREALAKQKALEKERLRKEKIKEQNKARLEKIKEAEKQKRLKRIEAAKAKLSKAGDKND